MMIMRAVPKSDPRVDRARVDRACQYPKFAAACKRCGAAFASELQVKDLITVEKQLGFNYEAGGEAGDGGAAHYQWICPKCRRAMFGLAQGALWDAGDERELATDERG